MPSVLGKRLAELRKKHKLSGQRLAEKIGVTQAYISHIENAENPSPKIDLITKMAQIFGVSVAYLMGETDTPQPPSPAFTAILNDYIADENEARPRDVVAELAQRSNIPREMIERYTRGEEPSGSHTHILMQAMGYEGRDGQKATRKLTMKNKSAQGITLAPESNASYIATTAVPLVSRDFPACCGNGNGYYDVDTYAEGTVFVKSSSLRFYDETRPPFAVRVEGDSMEEAGITEDCAVVINPADELRNGDTAFVVWNDTWLIRWVIWDRDGSVTLKSSNPSYQPIRIDKELAQDTSWFKVVGKVVATVKEGKPRGAF